MRHDVIIIGGGPAGLSFARSLAQWDLDVVVVERSPMSDLREPAPDGREIALTHQSVKILRQLGVWSRLPPEWISPIKEARVLDGDSSYFMNFHNEGPVGEPLGYLVPNHLIRQALFEEVAPMDNVEIMTEIAATDVATDVVQARVRLSNGDSMEAALVVAADSRFSETRRKMGIPAHSHDFSRVAIVCRMEHERPHDGVAFECFHYGRTLAVLPMPGEISSVVITAPTNLAAEITEMSDAVFNADVARRFDHRLGKMKLVGNRYAYPLVAVHADRFVATRFALIGDAAVGMHPVTAHGFNLGLSGQHTLAREISSARSNDRDIGSPSVLRRYESAHMRITRPMYYGTNGIVRLFTNDVLLAKALRKVVLRVGNDFPFVRRFITSRLTEAGPGRGLSL
jgi:ubiquinone biosynthesis UbiH/UbiF/VisC/COQ6 family hydroxylase